MKSVSKRDDEDTMGWAKPSEQREKDIAAAKNAQDNAQKAAAAEQANFTGDGTKKVDKYAADFASANNGIAYTQKH